MLFNIYIGKVNEKEPRSIFHSTYNMEFLSSATDISGVSDLSELDQ